MFDGVKDLCGLELEGEANLLVIKMYGLLYFLPGISSQSTVGFLSLLECLRYLEGEVYLNEFFVNKK